MTTGQPQCLYRVNDTSVSLPRQWQAVRWSTPRSEGFWDSEAPVGVAANRNRRAEPVAAQLEYQFICKLCKAAFPTSLTANRHVKSEHGVEDIFLTDHVQVQELK